MKKVLVLLIFIINLYIVNVDANELELEYIDWKKNINGNTPSSIINYEEEKDYSIDMALPSKYSSKDLGYITPVKNQYTNQNCWAFSSNACVETSAKKEGVGTYNLSERHMEYSLSRFAFANNDYNELGLNRKLNDGGNSIMASIYYYRFTGPVLNTLMPNTTTNPLISKSSFKTSKPELLVDTYENYYFNSCTSSNIASIKEKVMNYGAASVSIYWNDLYLNKTGYYRYTGDNGTNHGVTIIGWDDSISKNMFSPAASQDGAWIIKNSWGTSQGFDGYFYISYDDTNICNNVHLFHGITKNDYEYGYASSNGVYNMLLNYSSRKIYAASIFKKKSSNDEYLDRISIATVKGMSYNVYLSLNPKVESNNDWTLIGSGTSDAEGVKTIKFEPVKITKDYAVKVEYNSVGIAKLLASCKGVSDDFNEYFDFPTNTNYYSANGSSWLDMGLSNSFTREMTCAPHIYAYTKLEPPTTKLKINSTSSSSKNVKVGTKDYFISTLTIENITDYNNIEHKILDSSSKNVTHLFDIDFNVANNTVKLSLNANSQAGKYTYVISYKGLESSTSIRVYANVFSETYEIKDDIISVKLNDAKELTRKTFRSNITLSSNYEIKDQKKQVVIDNNAYIGTGYIIVVDDLEYKIILLGDINGDGKISALDYVKIRKYLMQDENITDSNYLKAANINGDGKVSALDYVAIRKFLMEV